MKSKLKQPVSESGDPKARQFVGESPTRTSAQLVPKLTAKPIGVARYVTKLMETLPAVLKGQLPTIAELERELGGGERATAVGRKKLRSC